MRPIPLASLCLATLPLSGGEVSPSPFAFESEHPILAVRAADLGLARDHFATSVFGRLTKTGWWAVLRKELDTAFEEVVRKDPQAPPITLDEVVAGSLAAGFSIHYDWNANAAAGHQMPKDDYLRPMLAWQHDRAEALEKPLFSLLGLEAAPTPPAAGKAKVIGRSWAFLLLRYGQTLGLDLNSQEDNPHIPQPDREAVPVRPGEDLEAVLDGYEAYRLFHAIAQHEAKSLLPRLPAVEVFAGSKAVAAWSLDPVGLREHLVVEHDAIPEMTAPSVDLKVFEGLGPDTLWAMTGTLAPGELAHWIDSLLILSQGGTVPVLPGVDAQLTESGLPTHKEMLRAVQGNFLIHAQTGAGIPPITLTLGMDEPVAQRLLGGLATRLQFQADDQGVYSGMLGPVPLAFTYRQGQLVLTSHLEGLKGALARPGGFTALPKVKARLADLGTEPARLVGLSRTGPSLSALAGSLLPLAMLEHDLAKTVTRFRLASLPADLSKLDEVGFVVVRQKAKTLEAQSGGVLTFVQIVPNLIAGIAHLTMVDYWLRSPPPPPSRTVPIP